MSGWPKMGVPTLSDSQEDFSDIFPSPCLWCGEPMGAHIVFDANHIYPRNPSNSGNCALEIKKALRVLDRIEAWLFEKGLSS